LLAITHHERMRLMQYISPEPPTFDSFYTSYLPLVRHVLGGLRGQSREYLDDLVQETFVRAWKGYDRLDHTQNVAAWISQIARHVASSFFRHRFAHQGLDCAVSGDEDMLSLLPDPHADTPLLCVEESDAIAHAYQQLPPDDQQVLALLAQEYTCAEIAEALRLDETTCKTRVKRARRRFARSYTRA
jgi:RNA polymerase sigma-70 factor (ECF subfamily)